MQDGEATPLAVYQEIVPGYKNDNPQDTENYRFFALNCTLAKIVRRVIAQRLHDYIRPFVPRSWFG